MCACACACACVYVCVTGKSHPVAIQFVWKRRRTHTACLDTTLTSVHQGISRFADVDVDMDMETSFTMAEMIRIMHNV